MVFDRHFAVGLAVRLVLLALALAAALAALATPGLLAARILAVLIVVGVAAEFWHFVRRTNRELARFIEAIRFGDLSASFARPAAGGGFDALGAALDGAIRRLRDERARLTDESRFFQAIVDDVPIALLLVDPEQRITPLGKAGRRMFGAATGVREAAYRRFGEEFAAALTGLAPGGRQLVRIEIDGGAQRALLRAATVHRLGGQHRVVAVQPIQEALNAVELATQSDLVRVLTHEIMNSMTPVTSLARTASALMAQLDPADAAAIDDARAAVDTLARRADGVMHFVDSYRQISRAPQIRRRSFPAAPFAAELQRLFEADFPPARVAFRAEIASGALAIDADPDLLAQVLINLLRNAAEAATEHGPAPQVTLRIGGQRGAGVAIEVEDNGPGVPPDRQTEIFLPFFTTKARGSGVGLSFARQVVLAHDGEIGVTKGAAGGALFRIRL
jgi:two-component system nitrogen regulation sensor histidine kinase NtrY